MSARHGQAYCLVRKRKGSPCLPALERSAWLRGPSMTLGRCFQMNKIEKSCGSCGKTRLCENRPKRQRMCRDCRRKSHNNPNYKRLGCWIRCIDCGANRKWWARPIGSSIATPVRCRSCNVARYKGADNPNWKGGITPENHKLRRTPEYVAWRISVFERDGYTCQFCAQVGGELHADHIKPFSLFPEHRVDINNGRTLCRRCHMLTPSYLGGARKLATQAKLRGPLLPFEDLT